MAVKVFILGCPGSGKSTAARHIAKQAEHKGWSPNHINDYDILCIIFQAGDGHNILSPAEQNNGFSVLDRVLKKLEKIDEEEAKKNSSRDELIVIVIALGAKTTSDLDSPQNKALRDWIPTNGKDAFFTLVALIYLVFAAVHYCITGDGSMLTYLLGAAAGYAGIKGISGTIKKE